MTSASSSTSWPRAQLLSAAARGLLALLPAHPTDTITPGTAGALAGITPAAARYWAHQLRAHVAAGEARGERRGAPPVGSAQIECFRQALAREITVLIERRTQRGHGGLEYTLSRRDERRLVYVVGMDRLDPSPVLAAGLEAAGLDPVELFACQSPSVHLGDDGAYVEANEHGQTVRLWGLGDSTA